LTLELWLSLDYNIIQVKTNEKATEAKAKQDLHSKEEQKEKNRRKVRKLISEILSLSVYTFYFKGWACVCVYTEYMQTKVFN
jgi:hypothetical protein